MKNILRKLMIGLLLSLWCFALSVVCVVIYQQTFSPVRYMDLDYRLDTLNQSVLLAIHESGAKERQARIEALNALQLTLDRLSLRLDEQQNDMAKLRSTQAHHGVRLDELGIDSQKLEALETKLRHLSRQPAVTKREPVQVKPVIQPTVKTPAITAPFVLFDVQTRGRIQLAIVGKPGARSLSELSALQAGQTYLGWKITAVNDQYIETLYKGQRTTLTLGEGGV
ncbi:hypothetical protein [uncultured Vibrio sp.]|uniref:hypothetical protein n=1 Tax=uncultured Vibrio sp. TaxID=114054 RepID=UPI00262E1DDD|nr:hypothetical protein [uncultured Vibrio sp.]